MRVMSCLLVLLVASTASAQDATDTVTCVLRVPTDGPYSVKRLTLERDAYRITLESGTPSICAALGATRSRRSSSGRAATP